MAKNWGVARFYGMGSMEYLLESGGWLADAGFLTARRFTFETRAEADANAEQFPKVSQPHGVQFMLDKQGKVLTARASQARPVSSSCATLTGSGPQICEIPLQSVFAPDETIEMHTRGHDVPC